MNIINIIFLAGVCLLPNVSLAQGSLSGNLCMKGHLAGVNDKLVVYSIDYGAKLGKALDTISVVNGVINALVYLDKPKHILLFEPFDKRKAGSVARIRFPGIPDESIVIDGKLNEYSISGSDFYQCYGEADALLKEDFRHLEKYAEEYDKMRKHPNKDIRERAAIVYHEHQNEQYSLISTKVLEFVHNHSDNDACASLISYLSEEALPLALNYMSDKVKEGRMSDCIQANIEHRKEQKAMNESKSLVRVGARAPIFSLNDIEGKRLSLNLFEGKYVLLDFWGSWCGPCIKSMSKLKDYYKKYGDRLEIIGIDCRDSEQRWRQAVIEHQLQWRHVRDSKEEGICVKYAVESFPTLILINPEGIIVKTSADNKDDLFTYIDEQLGIR